MPFKTEADIALKMKQLHEQKRAIIRAKNVALGEEVSRAIKSGKLDQDSLFEVLRVTVKSKKSRALIGLDESDSQTDEQQPPEVAPVTDDNQQQEPEEKPERELTRAEKSRRKFREIERELKHQERQNRQR